ncbi:MAG: sulfite exporter TauE/SafE family protein [Alphaproteobacteria bacterium]|nr:sulfite exporter TauE/SafE family protein [Alphaproteobacteria bacterium]
MTIVAIIIIIAFAFFAQSLLGFGGGLICIPILSLFMPVQDVVAMVMLHQFSMGLLIFKVHKNIGWMHIRKMIPMTVVGVIIGVFFLKILDGDWVRLGLAAYIILHLARKHTSFDPMGRMIEGGGVHLAGFLGGALNAMIGGGGPAFILYLKDKAENSSEFRANIIAMLMISNVPRAIGMAGTGLFTWDIFILGLYSYPTFLLALWAGQKLHDKIPQKVFFNAVEVLLFFSAMFLVIKVML